MNEAEREHLQSDLIAAQLDVARLRAALADGPIRSPTFTRRRARARLWSPPQRQFLLDQIAEQRAKLAALDRQQAQKEAERATIAATIAKLEAIIPILQQRVDIRKTLFEHETGSKLNYLETLQQLVEQQQELAVQKSQLQRGRGALVAAIEERARRPRRNTAAPCWTSSPRPSARRPGSPRT